MCGRYNVIDDPFLTGLLTLLDIDLVLPTRLNIAPTEQVPVVISRDGERQIQDMRWWLLPPWTKELNTKYSSFNARSETLAISKLFGRPYKSQRAILPASSFIEWQKTGANKQAQLIEDPEQALALAAVFERCKIEGNDIYSCSIVTRPATENFSGVHSRMPVMLRAEQFDDWLDPAVELHAQYAAFAQQPPDLRLTPLAKDVNNARNKAPTDQRVIGESKMIH
ncbi:MAG: SOS response-associated peptidase [Pseudomonadales bacterium]